MKEGWEKERRGAPRLEGARSIKIAFHFSSPVLTTESLIRNVCQKPPLVSLYGYILPVNYTSVDFFLIIVRCISVWRALALTPWFLLVPASETLPACYALPSLFLCSGLRAGAGLAHLLHPLCWFCSGRLSPPGSTLCHSWCIVSLQNCESRRARTWFYSLLEALCPRTPGTWKSFSKPLADEWVREGLEDLSDCASAGTVRRFATPKLPSGSCSPLVMPWLLQDFRFWGNEITKMTCRGNSGPRLLPLNSILYLLSSVISGLIQTWCPLKYLCGWNNQRLCQSDHVLPQDICVWETEE